MAHNKNILRSRPNFLIIAFALLMLGISNPVAEDCEAQRFGFRGGFRGGFGRSVGRSFSRSRGRRFSRVGRFRSFGFRGFRGFGRSRFHSVAFRGRRFGFNRFHRIGRFNRFGGRRFHSRFSRFHRPRFRSFAFSHFPTQRFHSGFRSFSSPYRSSVSRIVYSPPVKIGPVYSSPQTLVASSKVVSGRGWNQLATTQWANAGNTFLTKIENGVDSGSSRVGYALASAGRGDLDHGVWAMKRAFEFNMPELNDMMFEQDLIPSVEAVTRMYETRMEAKAEGADTSDDAFMLAALYQMQGDPEMAAMAADYINKAKGLDASTVNLTSMIKHEMKSIPMAKGAGWTYLAQGQSRLAIDEFIKEITANTNAGIPKLGFALATAELGDTEQAVWALRRAFEFDPDSVSDVVLDGELRPMLQRMTSRYEQEVENSGTNENNTLLLATLYQLRGDVEGAEFMVKQEKMPNDFYLTMMIKEEMKMQEMMLAKAMPTSSEPADSEMKPQLTIEGVVVDDITVGGVMIEGIVVEDVPANNPVANEVVVKLPMVEEPTEKSMTNNVFAKAPMGEKPMVETAMAEKTMMDKEVMAKDPLDKSMMEKEAMVEGPVNETMMDKPMTKKVMENPKLDDVVATAEMNK